MVKAEVAIETFIATSNKEAVIATVRRIQGKLSIDEADKAWDEISAIRERYDPSGIIDAHLAAYLTEDTQ
jgi:phosphopantothenate synthetase